MKTIGRRSIVLYFALILLVGGMLLLGFRLVKNGEDWVIQSYNGHLYASSSAVEIGTITDTNGVVLATSVDGTRTYSSSLAIRKSVLHTVGDIKGYIATSIESTQMSSLVGYNIFTGLNSTPLSDFGSSDITLTIDANLCTVAYEALNGLNGAVLLYNYETGEILCKVSAPSFDPLDIPSDINTNSDYSGAYIDNTISSSYTPGSIFKIVTATSAIENIENWETLTYCCEQTLYVDGATVTCTGNHGDQTMSEALGNSCNIYFACLAMELGADTLQETAEELGFNQNFSLDEFTTAKSSIDLENAESIDLAWAGVGQYTLTTNPMNMLLLMSAIANGGQAVEPSLIENSDSIDTISFMSSSTATELDSLLRNVVTNYYGDSSFSGFDVCGKTGTAEVGGDKDPNSWFVGYTQDAPYAFVVIVEEGGSGKTSAMTVAKEILSYLAD
ncbi:MAG: penicillin-binding transpeptidase domain-containing protein [Clostridia bacterium]